MQQNFSATSQGKSDFIVKFLHLQNQNNNKNLKKKYAQQGKKKSPKPENSAFARIVLVVPFPLK